MALYNTFKYGDGTKYGTANPVTLPNLLWGIEVDWDGDGFYSGENEATRTTGLNIQRGRRNMFQGNSIQHYLPGKASIILDNTDSRYDYFNASSPLYPNVRPGKFMRVKVRDTDADVTYELFHGIVTEVVPFRAGGVRKVRLVAEDGLRFLANQTLKTNFIQGKQYDALAFDSLVEAGWPTSRWNNIANMTTKGLGGWWEWGRDALSVVNDLADCAAGVFFHSRLGNAFLRGGNDTFISATLDLDESEVLTDISANLPWDTIRNEISVVVYRRYSITNTDVLYRISADDDQDLFVPTGTSRRFEVKLENDPGSLLAGETTHSTAARTMTYANPSDIFQDAQHSLDDTQGSGGIELSNFTFQIEKMSSHVIFTVNNFSGTDGYFVVTMAPSLVSNRNQPVTVTASDAASQAEYGKRSLVIDTQYVEKELYAQELADYLLSIYKDPQVYPVVRLQGRPQKQFQPDLFFYRFSLTAPSIGLSSAELFRVGGIEHNWLNENGNSVVTTFWLEPYNSLFSFTP